MNQQEEVQAGLFIFSSRSGSSAVHSSSSSLVPVAEALSRSSGAVSAGGGRRPTDQPYTMYLLTNRELTLIGHLLLADQLLTEAGTQVGAMEAVKRNRVQV